MRFAAGLLAAGILSTAQPVSQTLDAAVAARPVALSRVVVDIEPGTRIGKYKGGSLCISSDKFRWKQGSGPKLDTDLFEDAFRLHVVRLGFRPFDDPENLFAGADTGGADYLVAAKVETIEINVCYPNQGLGSVEKSKGRASVKVTWQIYSRAQRAVVASFTAEGAASQPQAQDGGPHTILMAAFGDSLRQFTEQPAFRDIFGAPNP
ncbi:MAG TPA: hypothetical protein VF619_00665 [Allosphingosinicella sp.]|jgi:hypothetical protein